MSLLAGGSNRRRRKRDRGSKQTQRRSGRKLHLAPFSFHALFGAKGERTLFARGRRRVFAFRGRVEPKNWVLLQSGALFGRRRRRRSEGLGIMAAAEDFWEGEIGSATLPNTERRREGQCTSCSTLRSAPGRLQGDQFLVNNNWKRGTV